MNTVSRSALIGAALVTLLVGCQKANEPTVTSSGQPSPNVTASVPPIAQTSTPDHSLPDAVGEVAGSQDIDALQHKAAPQEKMTKEEESKAMPLPSQANDHSTTALDKNKGK